LEYILIFKGYEAIMSNIHFFCECLLMMVPLGYSFLEQVSYMSFSKKGKFCLKIPISIQIKSPGKFCQGFFMD